MYVLIYVDDILITGSNKFSIDDLLRALQHDFAIKDLASLNFFLGIEAIQGRGSLFLSQQRYILNILNRTKMIRAKPIRTHIATSTK